MCRLLVDCDDNTSSVESIEEDPDDYFLEERDGKKSQYVVSQSPPGTGTVAMAKVWKNIVFMEVSGVSFLKLLVTVVNGFPPGFEGGWFTAAPECGCQCRGDL